MPPMKINSRPSSISSRPITPTNTSPAEASSSKPQPQSQPSKPDPRPSSTSSKPTLPPRPSAPPPPTDYYYDDDYHYTTHDGPSSSSTNHPFSEDTITMTFGSPSLSRTTYSSNHYPFDFDDHTSNSNSNANPKPRFASGPSGAISSTTTYRHSDDHASTSFDLASEQRFTDHHHHIANGFDPIERSPSSPPMLGRTAPVERGFGAALSGGGGGGVNGKVKERGVEEEGDMGLPQRREVAGAGAGKEKEKEKEVGGRDGKAGRNVWADDDDDDFGREREMEMTFE